MMDGNCYYKAEDIALAKRLIAEMRDNCRRKPTDKYDDPKREQKHHALNIAMDALNRLEPYEK